MARDFPLTFDERIASSAIRWLDGERWEESLPRQAATVMIVRDAEGEDASGHDGPEVFMLTRTSAMAFAPTSMVFPGGGVDRRDAEADLPWFGPSPQQWADRMGVTADEAQMFIAAAIREVFEECGVLFASNQPGGPLVDVSADRWRVVRDGLIGRELSLAQVLREYGLVLRSDLLAVKAHWLTPTFEPRRFDTWFFAAKMPAHQVADGDTTEADMADWMRPAELIEQYAAGTARMLPPTIVWVEKIGEAASAEDFIEHAEDLRLIMPAVVHGDDGPAMRID